MTSKEQRQSVYRACVVLFSVLGCAFLWTAVFTFNPLDWPSPNSYPHPEPAFNACGAAGAWVANRLFYYFGDGTYPLAMGFTLAAFLLTWRGSIPCFWQRVLGVLLLVTVTAVSVHLVSGPASAALPEERGGILGIAVGHWLNDSFSTTGTVLILAYCLFVGVAFTAEGLVLRAPAAIRQAGRVSARMITVARDRIPFQLIPSARPVLAPAGVGQSAPAEKPEERLPRIRSNRLEPPSQARPEGKEAAEGQNDASDTGPSEATATAVLAEPQAPAGDAPPPASTEAPDAEPSAEAEPPPRPPVKVVNLRTDVLAARENESDTAALPARAYPRELGEWQLPPLSVLTDPEYLFTAQQEPLVREKGKILERTLEEFRVEAHVVEIHTGPVVTMFELTLAAGVKVSQICTLANDIARALKAPAVRVVAPIPGKNTIGVEVPNIEKEIVRIKELITLGGSRLKSMSLPLFLGKDASGNPLISDLARMPHMLIAGTTGSGKSVCINTIIMSILMTQRPDMVKLILVDPKMVELSQFKDVPHLMCPIVTDMARAEKILEWATTKMDERYELLAEAGVRDIASFNRLSKDDIYERFMPSNEEEKAQIATHLPHIVIVIDELADLMMTSAKEVEHHLSRLAQKSRAVGIHIIVATQRPEAKIVTGLIKSNLPCRMAFRVASRMDSRIVLDQNGAEVLMGQGDALFLPPGSAKLIRAQGTYLDDGELRKVIDFLRQRGEPEFHPELVKMRSDDSGPAGERDPLFDEAVRIILETKRGSVSLLQRRLTIGYSRASRLIDQMADAGIVGTYKGSQAREVLMTLDEYEALRERMMQDKADGYKADQDDDAEGVPDLLDGDSDIRD